MNDIVDRLRDVAGFIQKEHGRVAAAACLATEAADEIERLRAQIGATKPNEVWMSYEKLAEHWGMSKEATRARVRRGGMKRRIAPNGEAEALVDLSAVIRKPRPPRSGSNFRATPSPVLVDHILDLFENAVSNAVKKGVGQ